MDPVPCDPRSILLFGAGGHGRVLMELALLSYERVYLGDSRATSASVSESRCEFIGTEDDVIRAWDEMPALGIHLCIGSNPVRKRLAERFSVLGAPFLSLIHARSSIAESACIGDGTSVLAGAAVNASARVGEHGIINTGCIIEHDCVLGDFVRCDPGAILCSGCRVGDGAVIGAGAILDRNVVVEPLQEVPPGAFVGSV